MANATRSFLHRHILEYDCRTSDRTMIPSPWMLSLDVPPITTLVSRILSKSSSSPWLLADVLPPEPRESVGNGP